MDKKKLKEFFEFVEKKLSKEKTNVGFSTWHVEPYNDFVDVVQSVVARSNTYIFNEQQYLITFSAARNGMGGMSEGSPDTWTVSKLVKTETFNADDFLNEKTFRIYDWKTGTKRVTNLGYNSTLDYELKDLFEIAENIFDCGYNIQIVKQLSGDVILMIENKNFIVS